MWWVDGWTRWSLWSSPTSVILWLSHLIEAPASLLAGSAADSEATLMLEDWTQNHEVLVCCLLQDKSSLASTDCPGAERRMRSEDCHKRKPCISPWCWRDGKNICRPVSKKKDLFLFTHGIQRKHITWVSNRALSPGETLGHFCLSCVNCNRENHLNFFPVFLYYQWWISASHFPPCDCQYSLMLFIPIANSKIAFRKYRKKIIVWFLLLWCLNRLCRCI